MPHDFPLDRSPSIWQLQAPDNVPSSSFVDEATDPLHVPEATRDALRHFPEEVYDLEPESNLARFMKTILGEAGAGQLRKRYLIAHLRHSLAGSHFFDFDRFYGSIFGIKRNPDEALKINPFVDLGTADEWREETSKDASYRSRIEGFARGINLSPTALGMQLVSESVLTTECEVHESYVDADRPHRSYGLIEQLFSTYEDLEGLTYGEIEDNPDADGQSPLRSRFVIRPKAEVSLAERYNLKRVLERLKPAWSRVEVIPLGSPTLEAVDVQGFHSDDEHWEIRRFISRNSEHAQHYPRTGDDGEMMVEQARPAFSGYQGEAWNYNADIVATEAYTETEEGVWGEFTPAESRVVFPDGSSMDYRADKAIAPARFLLAGRIVSDGIITSSPYVYPEWSRGDRSQGVSSG